MKSLRHLIVLPILLLASCEGGISDPPSVQRTTILGTIELRTLGGDVAALPYNNVTVTLLHGIKTGGYTETALSSGLWAFRNIELDDYLGYATSPGYGRSEDLVIDTTNRSDSILFVLAEQPTAKPVLDSVTGSWDSGYTLYGSFHRTGAEQIGVLVRAAGESTDLLRVLMGGFTPVRLDSIHYKLYSDKRPLYFPSHPEFALVAFNPAVGAYTNAYAAFRYCSEGPASNVMAPR